METDHTEPTVDVVIPARNEEDCIGRCLQSLLTQQGISFRITVVDDVSTDRTRAIAESFPDVRVLSAGEPKSGVIGKCNALITGVAGSKAQWLLFTDADTFHYPGSLAASVREAEERQVDLLSYSPEQEVRSFWEKAVMPVVFAELASSFRPVEVSNPRSAVAAANGQYLLMSREAYAAVGGFASVATTLLEDVAMARAVKASGRKTFFRYGPDAVRTRMYRNFVELRDGWTKNLVLLFPSTNRLAALRLMEFVLIVGCATLAVVGAAKERAHTGIVAAGVGAVIYVLFVMRIRKAHFRWDANLFSLLGLPVFAYLLLRSRLFHGRGKVSWKGRLYDGEASQVDNRTFQKAAKTEITPAAPLPPL